MGRGMRRDCAIIGVVYPTTGHVGYVCLVYQVGTWVYHAGVPRYTYIPRPRERKRARTFWHLHVRGYRGNVARPCRCGHSGPMTRLVRGVYPSSELLIDTHGSLSKMCVRRRTRYPTRSRTYALPSRERAPHAYVHDQLIHDIGSPHGPRGHNIFSLKKKNVFIKYLYIYLRRHANTTQRLVRYIDPKRTQRKFSPVVGVPKRIITDYNTHLLLFRYKLIRPMCFKIMEA